jgi:uncharacterized integral membrane protein (TIGR00698 family)
MVNAAMALAIGILLGVTVGSPSNLFGKAASKWGSLLLRSAVVGLGFGINIGVLLQTGQSIFVSTTIFVASSLLFGLLLGRILKVEPIVAILVSVGTAICGGSAIATIGAVLRADDNQMSISTATIFLLNAVALLVFPSLGHAFGLSENQFGEWAAIAIHDTSSVVGAAARYGDDALRVASVTKMVRILWIIPIAFYYAYEVKKRQPSSSNKVSFPFFIVGFLVSSVVFSLSVAYFPASSDVFKVLYGIAKQALVVSLLLIGAAISVKEVRAVGVKVFIQAIILWIVVSVAAFLFVR